MGHSDYCWLVPMGALARMNKLDWVCAGVSVGTAACLGWLALQYSWAAFGCGLFLIYLWVTETNRLEGIIQAEAQEKAELQKQVVTLRTTVEQMVKAEMRASMLMRRGKNAYSTNSL